MSTVVKGITRIYLSNEQLEKLYGFMLMNPQCKRFRLDYYENGLASELNINTADNVYSSDSRDISDFSYGN